MFFLKLRLFSNGNETEILSYDFENNRFAVCEHCQHCLFYIFLLAVERRDVLLGLSVYEQRVELGEQTGLDQRVRVQDIQLEDGLGRREGESG